MFAANVAAQFGLLLLHFRGSDIAATSAEARVR